MVDIEGKHAFITGGANGIGLGIALALADAGARVTLADLDTSALAEAVSLRPGRFAAVELDVRDRSAWKLARASAEERFGSVDVLINNAGIGPDGHVLVETDSSSFDRVVAINITGVFNGVSEFAGAMCKRGEGHILNTASGGGFFTAPAKAAYVMSKFAVVALSECLRDELSSFGVGVSVLVPGPTHSRIAETTRSLGSDTSDDGPSSSWKATSEGVGRRTLTGLLADEFYLFADPTPGPRAAHLKRYAAIMEAFDQQAVEYASGFD